MADETRSPNPLAAASGPAQENGNDSPKDEIVYAPPDDHGERISSAGAVRGPRNAAGSVDRANLSEEMARTYAVEGHRDEALEIYRLLLLERPGDPDLLQHLHDLQRRAGEDKGRPGRPKLAPSSTGPHSEPFGMLDLEELPEVYGVNEVEVLYKDPWWSFVYWEVTESGIGAARAQLGPAADSARLMLRLFTTQPSVGATSREVRDVPLSWNHGRRYIDIPRPGSYLRVAIGLLSGEGYFAPIAHSSLLRLPPPHPSPAGAGPPGQGIDWMQVQPARGRGEQRERILILSRSVTHSERGLSWRVAAVSAQGMPEKGAEKGMPDDSEPRLEQGEGWPGTTVYPAPGSGGLR